MDPTHLPKILIIEDEAIVSRSLSAFLLQQYDVITATEGEGGLELMKSQRPDLVLLDLLLPDVDGYEILRRKKNEPEIATIPVIVLSNVAEKESIEKTFELGAVDYLIKEEVNFEVIRLKVEMALNNGNNR